MNELQKILSAMFPKLGGKQIKGIVSLLGLSDDVQVVDTTAEAEEDETKKSVTIESIATRLQKMGYKPELPGLTYADATQKGGHLPYSTRRPDPTDEENDADADDDENDDNESDSKPRSVAARHQKAINAAYLMKYGEKDPAMKAIMSDILGDDYENTLFNQEVAFAKYVRGGEKRLDRKEMKLLDTQIYPLKHIMSLVTDGGLDVRSIKATQIESQGELGGIAVPPQRQTQIETRLPGLTAVRGAGANVITLVNGSSVEIPQWRTDDTTDQRYIGMIRGERGNETKTPNAKNFKLDLVPLVAYLYTFKVPMSQSLVEDAANLVTMLMNDIAITLAMDEDEEFLIGDGVGKSLGILPGGTNALTLKEVVSTSASALTVAGIKKLKRGLAAQYRKNGVFVANSDTWSTVEAFTAGAGLSNWAFPDLAEDDRLLGRQTYETEVMPDIAANTYPLIFGDMAGYDIVERLGMSILRFQDSNTGINKVEYHVRKRYGGQVEKPWLFSVQKVSA